MVPRDWSSRPAVDRSITAPGLESSSVAPAPRRSPAAALSLMALSSMLFALMNLLARLATASASWASVAAVRATVGVLVAFSIARIRGRSLAATRRNRGAILWRSVFGTVSMLLTFYALGSHTVSLGNTATLLNLAPLFIAVLAPIFLRESTRPLVAVAIVIAFAGVVFVMRPSFIFGGGEDYALGRSGPTATMTTVAAVAAAGSTSIAMMLLRRVGQTDSAEVVAFHFSTLAAATTTVLALFDLRMPQPRDALYMIGAGICAGVAQVTMSRAYALENAARVSGMSYLSVVASALLGAALLGERPTSTAVLGMGLVIAGGLLVTLRGPRAHA